MFCPRKPAFQTKPLKVLTLSQHVWSKKASSLQKLKLKVIKNKNFKLRISSQRAPVILFLIFNPLAWMGWLAGLKCRKHHQALYYSRPTGYLQPLSSCSLGDVNGQGLRPIPKGSTCNTNKLGHSLLLSTANPAIGNPSIKKLSLDTGNKITGAPKNRALHF